MRKILLLSLLTGRAFALNQSVHYQISYDACRSAGGPDSFCEQVAVAAHNVDDYEFNDLAAHSQMEDGQSACDAANASIWRVFWFGQQIRPAAQRAAIDPTHAAISNLAQYVGRTLHTLQDNCAHSGMPNPEHSWRSMSDLCNHTSISPDVQPAALDCARADTGVLIDAVFSVLEDNGAEKAALTDVEEEHDHLTNYGDACHFLGEASTWDGGDRRWDNNIVRPYMLNEAVAAITTDGAQHGWVCDSAPDGILVSYDDDVDVSGGSPSCALISAFCLGKADEVQPTVAPAKASSGCDVGGGNFGGAALVVIALLLISRRRISV